MELNKNKIRKRKMNSLYLFSLLFSLCFIIIYFYAGIESLLSNTEQVHRKRPIAILSSGEPVSKIQSRVHDSSPGLQIRHKHTRNNGLVDEPIFSMRNFFAKNQDKSLSQGLLNEISQGKIEVNQSLKVGDEYYTALFMAIALDTDLNTQQMQEFMELGSHINNSPTWIAAASTLNSENLTFLLDNGLDPHTRFLGLRLANLVLAYGNIDTVELLRSRGYDLEKVSTIEYPPPYGQGSSGVVNLRDHINEIQDLKKKDKILKYLDRTGL